ncbi:PREDICTED: uncharacterized protein LOC109177024 [Ipomoea nil]|uniref:uncharacterized protein LOC109177024 n=1 Tax=Ipomoea nil TaxID=35883 RepID=UPI0009011CFF|nr:PREDICTED: uncharacterized protein LOC109177024 [Ipomoea nil]
MVNPVTLGPKYLQDTITKVKRIQEKMKAAQDRKKSYADLGRKQAELSTGEKVWLKISPTRGVMRFGKKGKLSPRFIGPYEIFEKVGNLAYRLALPAELEWVHNVFHISQLKKYVHDASHVVQPKAVSLDDTLTYEEKSVRILDTKTRTNRQRTTEMVKILWSNHGTEEATWEFKEAMRERYSELFTQVPDEAERAIAKREKEEVIGAEEEEAEEEYTTTEKTQKVEKTMPTATVA